MRTILTRLFIVSFLLAGLSSSAQLSSACVYSTCVPQKNFTNSDLLQIYGAIVKGVNQSTAVVTSGSVVVTSGTVTLSPPNVTVSTGTVTVGSGSVTVTSGTVSGNVGGYTTKYTHTITTDGLYAPGDCVGGVLTFTNVFRTGQTSGILQDLEIWDNNGQNANLVIDIYGESPTTGTFTNNSPTVLGDPTIYLGTVLVNTVDYVTTGSKSRACITGIGIALYSTAAPPATRNLWMTITTTSSPTYGTNSTSLYVKAGVLLD